MKLIRLSTEDNSGFFDNEFNANIEIKPNSKIALTNISLEARQNEIIIDSSNDIIYHQYKAIDGLKSFKINHGSYSSSNYDVLLNEIQTKANLSLSDVGVEMGMQWYVSVNSLSKKVNLHLDRASLEDPGDSWILNDISIINDGSVSNPKYIYSSFEENNNSSNDSQMYLDEQMCNGSGVFRARIETLEADGLDAEDGFYFGLTKIDPTDIEKVSVQNLEYGIRATAQGDRYNIVISGTEYNAIDNPNICNDVLLSKSLADNPNNDNDIVQISMNEGFIQIKVHQKIGTNPADKNVIVYSQRLPEELYNTVFYPVIIFRGGKDKCKLSSVRFTKNPFLTDSVYQEAVGGGLGFSPPPQNNVPTNMYLQFGSISLATFLGFDNQRSPLTGFVKSPTHNYSGNIQFVITDIADSFILELLNINLESYDSFSKQRRNILSVIPKTELLNGQIIYEASNLIFLNIDNANAFSLRNIKARLLKNDLSRLDINGLAIATILIKDSDE